MRIRWIKEKCTNCMLCVKDCASAVWQNIDGIPTIAAPDDCNKCSHCLAVCPHGAVENDYLDHMQIEKINTDLIDPEVYETIIRGRRSVRQYKNKNIPDELIGKIIHLANHTPTASNSQTVGYLVISDKKILKDWPLQKQNNTLFCYDFLRFCRDRYPELRLRYSRHSTVAKPGFSPCVWYG